MYEKAAVFQLELALVKKHCIMWGPVILKSLILISNTLNVLSTEQIMLMLFQ